MKEYSPKREPSRGRTGNHAGNLEQWKLVFFINHFPDFSFAGLLLILVKMIGMNLLLKGIVLPSCMFFLYLIGTKLRISGDKVFEIFLSTFYITY